MGRAPGEISLSLKDGRLLVSMAAEGLAGDRVPLELWLDGRCVATAEAQIESSRVEASFAVPAAAMRDGAVVLDVHAFEGGGLLGRYALLAGDAVPEDALAELALLRAELEALKKAFLRDGADPKLRRADRGLIVAEAVERAVTEVRAVTHPGADPKDRG